MQRTAFGSWGAGLSDDDFAQALAGLGLHWTLTAVNPEAAREFESAGDQGSARKSNRLQLVPISVGPLLVASVSAGLLKYPGEWYRDRWRTLIAERDESPLLPWIQGLFKPDDALRIQLMPYVSNQQAWLAKDARECVLSEDDLALLEAVAQKLRAASVYFPIPRSVAPQPYQWPLRVGVLDNTTFGLSGHLADVASLTRRGPIASREAEGGWQQLLNIEKIDVGFFGGTTPTVVDWLFIEADDISKARELIERSTVTTTSGCLVLAREQSSASMWRQLLAWARKSPQCPAVLAVVWLPARRGAAVEWLQQFVTGISLSVPVDIALRSASLGLNQGLTAPLTFADPEFLRCSRLSEVAENAIETALPQDSTDWVNIPGWIADRLGLPDRPLPVQIVRTRLQGLMRDGESFWRPRGEGILPSFGSMLVGLLAIALRKTSPFAPENAPTPRWMQALVLAGPLTRGSVPLHSGFRPGVAHTIISWIGPAESGTARTEGSPFPDDQLPWDEGKSHQLMVVFTEPRFAPVPQVREITLPTLGASTRCEFSLALPELVAGQDDKVEARIAVYHKNRVLQTALLQGPVAMGPEGAGTNITLTIETAARAGLVGLDFEGRQQFDLALVVHHTPDKKPAVSGFAGGNACLVSFDDVQGLIEEAARLLGEASRLEGNHGLNRNAADDLLRRLTIHGALCYERLYLNTSLRVLDSVNPARYVQVVAAKPDALLPIELLYEGPVPKTDARICPVGRDALAIRADSAIPPCPENCPTKGPNEAVICPQRLWGLSRVIERHVFDPQKAVGISDNQFRLQIDPTREKRALPVLRSALLGASSRVHKQNAAELDELRNALNNLTACPPVMLAGSWAAWKDAVRRSQPSLLVLLPHCDVDHKVNLVFLEIGDGKGTETNLRLNDLDKEYVRTESGEVGPVILLLGCTTAYSEASYKSFVSRLRYMGAVIVVGTLSVILGRHAAPAASQLVKELAAISEERPEISFGEALLTVRRRLAANDVLAVLGFVAYGDADWVVVGLQKGESSVHH